MCLIVYAFCEVVRLCVGMFECVMAYEKIVGPESIGVLVICRPPSLVRSVLPSYCWYRIIERLSDQDVVDGDMD